MIYSIEKAEFSVSFDITATSCRISGGHFYDVALRECDLFFATVSNPATGDTKKLSSSSVWESVTCRAYGDTYSFAFTNPEGCGDIVFFCNAVADETGMTWRCEVENDSKEWSVEGISYPSPLVAAASLDFFNPAYAGLFHRDTAKKPIFYNTTYPSTHATMQYFAFSAQRGGLYLGYHDPDACVKQIIATAGDYREDIGVHDGYYEISDLKKQIPVATKEDEGFVYTVFPAINAGAVENSFTVAGEMRWQAFAGDWYDATQIYTAFVETYAKWLPAIDENGRPDTAEKFKEIPFWITDYIPNSPEQLEARPMVLGAVSQLYDKNYWFEAPIELKEKLGVPVAYHVYNWHKIPFNINYPHYTPARDEFFRGAEKLKAAGLYLMPYINAVSWEEKDADEGFAINFRDIGHKGATVKRDGSYCRSEYPQVKRDGTKTQLMPICPSFALWHQLIERETREIERTMPVDGVYFDEIAAHAAYPCYAKDHGHLPGGGSYWADGYNRMMAKVNAKKPAEAFYFTENNAEPYMKSFDGYLTWLWREEDSVPAFPAVYAGYVQMVGRFTDGVSREDDLLFRYHIAEGLLYGQQLGWVNAAVVYREKRMEFLKKIVHLRYENSQVFNGGTLCRPPKVASSLSPVTSSGMKMAQVVAGAWKMRKDGKLHLFAINVAEESAAASISFPYKEYGVSENRLPAGVTAENGIATWTLTLDAYGTAKLAF